MKPILWEFGDTVIPSWHFFFVLGVVAAFIVFRHLAQTTRLNLNEAEVSTLLCLVYIAGYLGARGLHLFVVDGIGALFPGLFELGGMVLYGGILGGGIAGWVYLAKKNVNWGHCLDCIVPAVLVGIALGRIGCFLNGDDYGVSVSENLAYLGVANPILGDGILRHPVQLYEALACLVAAIASFSIVKWQLWKPGQVALWGTLYYCLLRFFDEYLRGDPRGWIFDSHLSTSQGISLLMALVAVSMVLVRSRGSRLKTSRI